MQQFYGDKYASKEKCVLVQANSKTWKKNIIRKRNTKNVGISTWYQCISLIYVTDENGKCFFFLINIFIWNSERESIAERKKGNEVKAGKWKHVPYLYVRYIFLAGVTDIYSSGTHITIKFIVNGHPKLPIIECTPHWMMIERKLKFTIQLNLVSFRITCEEKFFFITVRFCYIHKQSFKVKQFLSLQWGSVNIIHKLASINSKEKIITKMLIFNYYSTFFF